MPEVHKDSVKQPGRTGNSPTLLVADDEACSRDPIAELLERAGYEILTACNSSEAVSVFRENAERIVAVLLDYHMPGGTGTQVFSELQRIRPNVPVIMMSGFVEERALGQFLGMGVVGFLQKPFNHTTLLNTVRRAIDPHAA
jgi:DNA-binding NtrC family response regulator